MKSFSRLILTALLVLALSAFIASCGGGGGGGNTAGNTAPVSDAGPVQNVTTGTLVTLDGSGSSDANGDTLTYSWSFTSKPASSAAALSSAAVVSPTFTADKDGAYVLSLVVNDGRVSSTADTVTITAATANSAPVANAGIDQNVATSSVVTLDGSGSSDANGDTLTYSWSFTSKPASSAAALSSAAVVSPTFTADKDGAYVLSLVVNDGRVSSTADTVTITAATANSAPVANAGIDQNVATSSVVTLDGSGSSDANGDTLTYSWSFTSKPASSAAALSSAAVVSSTFTADKDGAYVLSLIVNDGRVSSTADTVTITAATANSAPVANAGIDQNVATSSVVTLDGSGSSDANGDTLTYSWSFTSKPASSAAALSSAAVVSPTFTADKDGAYVLSLVVNDGTVSSTADTVTITAATPFPGSATFKMPDTNQTTSYTAVFGEDHDYTINPPSYTDNLDGTITDNVTGLMWQKCSNGQGVTDCASGTAATYNWYQAAGIADGTSNPDGATNVCGELTLAGQTDWRLPSRIELVSLIDNGIYSPAINATYFPSTISSSYWSSITLASSTSYAWFVYFDYGYSYYDGKTDTVYARCVRGGQ